MESSKKCVGGLERKRSVYKSWIQWNGTVETILMNQRRPCYWCCTNRETCTWRGTTSRCCSSRHLSLRLCLFEAMHIVLGKIPVVGPYQRSQSHFQVFLERRKVRISHSIALDTFGDHGFGLHAQFCVLRHFDALDEDSNKQEQVSSTLFLS